jgi:hypothetical protein
LFLVGLIVVFKRFAQKSSDNISTNFGVRITIVTAASVLAFVDVVADVQRRVVDEAVGAKVVVFCLIDIAVNNVVDGFVNGC